MPGLALGLFSLAMGVVVAENQVKHVVFVTFCSFTLLLLVNAYYFTYVNSLIPLLNPLLLPSSTMVSTEK